MFAERQVRPLRRGDGPGHWLSRDRRWHFARWPVRPYTWDAYLKGDPEYDGNEPMFDRALTLDECVRDVERWEARRLADTATDSA